MFPTLIKSFPLIVDGISTAIGIGAATSAGSVTDSINDSRTGLIELPEYIPARDGGMRRRTGQLMTLSTDRVREIKNSALNRNEIDSKKRLEDLDMMSDDSLTDHLSEMIAEYEYEQNELEDVDLMLDNIPINRLPHRRRLLRRVVLATTLIGLPTIGGTSIAIGLMGQNRNSIRLPPKSITDVDDCPNGEGVYPGPGGVTLTMNGVTRCNIRKIFLNVFIYYSYLIHNGIELTTAYWTFVWPLIYTSDVMQYFFQYDKRLGKLESTSETNIINRINDSLTMSTNDIFTQAVKSADKRFSAYYYSPMSENFFISMDTDFEFYLRGVPDSMNKFKKVLDEYSWFFSIELSKSPMDSYTVYKQLKLKDTANYALFKEQLKHVFPKDNQQIIGYLLTEVTNPHKTLYNMNIFKTITQALADLNVKNIVHQRLTDEIFRAPYEKFLKQLEYPFDPETQPPWVNADLKRNTQGDEGVLSSLINLWYNKNSQVSYALPDLTKGSYRLYNRGLVLVNGNIHTILHVANDYLGVIVLDFKTGDCKLGFLGSYRDNFNWYPTPRYDAANPNTKMKLYPFALIVEETVPLTGDGLATGNVSLQFKRFDITTHIMDSVQKLHMLVAHSFQFVKTQTKAAYEGVVGISYEGILFVTLSTAQVSLAVYTGAATGVKYVFDLSGQVLGNTIGLINVIAYGAVGIAIVVAANQFDNKRRRIQ
jgi:hypothetical protein